MECPNYFICDMCMGEFPQDGIVFVDEFDGNFLLTFPTCVRCFRNEYPFTATAQLEGHYV